MERADALEFLAAEQDKLSHRLECALKVPCRAYYEKLSEAYIQAIFALKENRTLRNELCLKCGMYKTAHEGACDGCRWHRKGENV